VGGVSYIEGKSMRRARLLFICVVVASIAAIEPAQACTCSAPATTAEALKRSSAVFSGRVTEIGLSFSDRIGLTRSGSHRVKFEILKQWKGTPSKSAVVITRLTGEACGFPFEEKKEYLVYVVTEPKDIQTGICTGTKNIAEAEHEMKQLDELRNRSQ
jgi:hypothetical protein